MSENLSLEELFNVLLGAIKSKDIQISTNQIMIDGLKTRLLDLEAKVAGIEKSVLGGFERLLQNDSDALLINTKEKKIKSKGTTGGDRIKNELLAEGSYTFTNIDTQATIPVTVINAGGVIIDDAIPAGTYTYVKN